jgi:hypothetical protein
MSTHLYGLLPPNRFLKIALGGFVVCSTLNHRHSSDYTAIWRHRPMCDSNHVSLFISQRAQCCEVIVLRGPWDSDEYSRTTQTWNDQKNYVLRDFKFLTAPMCWGFNSSGIRRRVLLGEYFPKFRSWTHLVPPKFRKIIARWRFVSSQKTSSSNWSN